MFEEVKNIILEQFDIDENEITLDSNIVEDFKADSLDLIELCSAIEEKYDINLEKNELKKIVKVKDLIKIIEEKKS